MDQRALSVLELFPPGRCRRILRYLAEHREDIDDPIKCGPIVIHCGKTDKVSVSDQRPQEVTLD